jgi:dolichol-phosphate mannosyltransferase
MDHANRRAGETGATSPDAGAAADCATLGLAVWVVLPTYNESANLPGIIDAVRAQTPTPAILVVDDDSPDGTGELADQIAQRLGPVAVAVVHRTGKSGLGSAYRAGFAAALTRGADVVIAMDSDWQHDPDDLPRLLAPITTDAAVDLVIGSRYMPGGEIPNWSFGRRFISWGGNQLARIACGARVRDYTSGFRAYRAAALRRLDLDRVRAEGYGFQIEMAAAVAFTGRGKVTEVPIRFGHRRAGESKMSAAIAGEALRRVALLTWRRLFRRRHYRRPAEPPVIPVSGPESAGSG